jgi:hypothetical protein
MARGSTIAALAATTALYLLGCSTERPIEPRDKPSGAKAADDGMPERQIPPAPRPNAVERQLLLVGLDGADWRVIDPLLAAGRLPHLARLIAGGSRAPLKTFKSCLSPLIWTTIATGVGPLKHGITGFTAQVPDSGEELLVTSNLRRVEALWNIASSNGRSAGVIGWWASYPAEEIKGFVISDQASTLRRENYRAALAIDQSAANDGTGATWPPALAKELAASLQLPAAAEPGLLERFVELDQQRTAELLAEPRVDVEDILSIFKFALLIDRSFIESGIAAIRKHHPDLALLYLNGLDAAEHHFWKFRQPERFSGVSKADVSRYGKLIGEYYVYMDEVLGRIIAEHDASKLTVIVVSDHGHEANPHHDPKSKDHFNRVCSGTHEEAPDGVLILSGKDIRTGAELRRPNIFDVTPTVLALMGIPVGEDMPGRVLDEGIAAAFLQAHPVQTVPTHSANRAFSRVPVKSAISEELKKKLEGLGYIK